MYVFVEMGCSGDACRGGNCRVVRVTREKKKAFVSVHKGWVDKQAGCMHVCMHRQCRAWSVQPVVDRTYTTNETLTTKKYK